MARPQIDIIGPQGRDESSLQQLLEFVDIHGHLRPHYEAPMSRHFGHEMNLVGIRK
jgi:hypothetical protein